MSEKKTIQYWGLRSADFYERCEGEVITIHLMTSEELHGELLGVDRYDVTFAPSDGKTLLIPKHAIAYVALTEWDTEHHPAQGIALPWPVTRGATQATAAGGQW